MTAVRKKTPAYQIEVQFFERGHSVISRKSSLLTPEGNFIIQKARIMILKRLCAIRKLNGKTITIGNFGSNDTHQSGEARLEMSQNTKTSFKPSCKSED